MAGLEAAKARGRHGGRPRALGEGKAKLARRLKDESEHSVEEICSMLGVGRSTVAGALTAQEGHKVSRVLGLREPARGVCRRATLQREQFHQWTSRHVGYEHNLLLPDSLHAAPTKTGTLG